MADLIPKPAFDAPPKLLPLLLRQLTPSHTDIGVHRSPERGVKLRLHFPINWQRRRVAQFHVIDARCFPSSAASFAKASAAPWSVAAMPPKVQNAVNQRIAEQRAFHMDQRQPPQPAALA